MAQTPLIPLVLTPPLASCLTSSFSRNYINQDMLREFKYRAKLDMNLDHIYDHYSNFNVAC